MRKITFLLSCLLLLPISAICASLAEKNGLIVDVPKSGTPDQKITLQAHTSEQLPASSFYRVEIECPDKPEGGNVAVEAGYPLSDLMFNKEGSYKCVVSLGILTKSSCAGIHYKPLGEYEFSIEIRPE